MDAAVTAACVDCFSFNYIHTNKRNVKAQCRIQQSVHMQDNQYRLAHSNDDLIGTDIK